MDSRGAEDTALPLLFQQHTLIHKGESFYGSCSVAQFSYSIFLLVYPSLLRSVYCHEFLVWLEASCFCYNTDNGLSLGLLLTIQLLSCVTKILLFEICRLFVILKDLFWTEFRSRSSQWGQPMSSGNLFLVLFFGCLHSISQRLVYAEVSSLLFLVCCFFKAVH